MADENTSLPIRTETDGDVGAILVDKLVPSQSAEIDSNRDLHVTSKLTDSGGSPIGTLANPLVVEQTDGVSGDPVADHDDSGDLAKDATSNHDYTVTAAKTLLLYGYEGSSSGKSKWEIQVETGVGAGTFTSHGVTFNSTATPDTDFEFKKPLEIGAGIIVRVVKTSRENPGHSVYSTIMGIEV